jgi:DNA cross-link repair 1C protein
MSTFDGKVKEFPDIRIDHFRLSVETSRPPLAYFLSHVHSDHLEGLESCKSPFIYCSPATKEIILRLEKYPHRMNFAKGILEARKQTYKHLRKLLKTIPLETPTVIDLAPSRSIRVTLFDANHCVGAVMFLIEGDGKSVLYTGDIRSELWWVNNLARHPLMLAYTFSGGKASLKQLDCIYLDTTFANKEDPYRHFPSKAEGILELLQKVSKYPKGTVFYIDTWTFGYEDVWMALCGFLDCQVHVDNYRYRLYRALATGEGVKAEEAARLFGYNCGNHVQEGCLTKRQTQLHSCEQGTGCEVFKKGKSAPHKSGQIN